MDRNKRELEALVSSQKEQLIRYEKRLKDVVTAYKGLLKEKEALESSLAALTTSKETNNEKASSDVSSRGISDALDAKKVDDPDIAPPDDSNCVIDEKQQLQSQIMTLMNSLATLSAEKSRMEASFQADKKHLRGQLTQKDDCIADLKKTIKENEVKAKAHLDEIKAKWIIECQEREKETNNQMIMIRELQKLYADERHLKENIEMQLNNFKTQFANNETENARIRELQAQLKESKAQLKEMKLGGNSSQLTAKDVGDPTDNMIILKQVQQQMQQLKEQHAIAIKNEQRRVLQAEDQSRRQAALHEDRVANLEERLAELSATVGNYDRLRQQDQESIHVLRKKLQELERSSDSQSSFPSELNSFDVDQSRRRKSNITYDISVIVDEIIHLKKLLLAENSRSTNPVDISKLFSVSAEHTQCHEELASLQHQYDSCKAELAQQQDRLHSQKTHISTLQEKVKVLNRNIDEQELDLKNQAEKMRNALKEERAKWKNKLSELENETRCKVVDLEQQLQKQRQRSLQLLDEKEQEIKTLQTSFEIFHNVTSPSTVDVHSENLPTSASDAESNDGVGAGSGNTQLSSKVPIKSKKLSVGENCHMLHYANEIARKDIEIAALRKAKYVAESSLRKAIQEKVNAQEDLCDKIALLEEQVDRLERCKTREGANLEYLKNVIISYIVTRDPDGKRHMLNAISAVLQLTPAEMQTINNAFQKK
ncbi:GRIP and coiled-coil domain-containing protein 1 [Bactrocera neohumeralis]|uniref:GRIP and coiled-coil domain-containing protein 1 n=1 Tax=Bactrocera neohumeralis TaxID=98809 RepID=UPI00216656AC|nr:GRIP and coiled-coil domain-containing protein 1 [Bactrocera neohumeralis]